MASFPVVLAAPRGFCAGVDRAIEIVERALERFGAPIYVRHEIVHNRHVVEGLRRKGAVFVEEVEEIPEGAVAIFSAHGVSRAVVNQAGERSLQVLDATCPLVTKVHREAQQAVREGKTLILIGHQGHPEVEGTLGQVPPERIHLVETVEDVEALNLDAQVPMAYVTQTTLSMDDTAQIVDALRRKYPSIDSPRQEDICYATQNRQNAVKALSRRCDVILVLGAPNSSNSNRLKEVAEEMGSRSYLVQSASDFDEAWVEGATAVGVTAGASAPESLVEELVQILLQHGASEVETLSVAEEQVQFTLPPELLDA
ncbi:MAG: 4-hydroxy-3-methylbut-2-enyl diphosphate reductase [Planctomycetota bacterium]|nr:4-hydroxy-3-methylbut-2-enyl diphosphate reductase [Planctomycetota bacterium]